MVFGVQACLFGMFSSFERERGVVVSSYRGLLSRSMFVFRVCYMLFLGVLE